jgi:FSR family fosmidomycin resistance protein-like MFS transporter
MMAKFLPLISYGLTLLFIEYLDELIYGAREAAWPLIRNDFHLTYIQVGILLSTPNLVGNFVEPVIGILGDIWKRRVLIIGGGVVFIISLILTAISGSFWPLLISFVLFFPASGAFVSLSQASLMDSDPEQHEQNMARWTFAGSLGIVIGPLVFGLVILLGWNWRILFFGFAFLSMFALFLVARFPLKVADSDWSVAKEPSLDIATIRIGIINAFKALQQREVLRWLILLEFADLTLDVFHGFLALYFVDVAGLEPIQAGLAVAVWTGFGLMGDFLLILLLKKVKGLDYLRLSAFLVLVIYPGFLLASNIMGKMILVGFLGLLNAGWYAIPKGRLYSAMPGQSGTVIAVGNIFNLVGGLVPLFIGIVAQRFGLHNAIWLIILGPFALFFGIPRKDN